MGILTTLTSKKPKLEEVNPEADPKPSTTSDAHLQQGVFYNDYDTPPKDYEDKYTLYRENYRAYHEVNDMVNLSIPDFKIIARKNQEEENPGVIAIREWMEEWNLYDQFRIRMRELVRDRRGGDSIANAVTIKNKLFNGGKPITVAIQVLSPGSIRWFECKRDYNGNWIYFVQDGERRTEWDKDECRNLFHIRWGENTYSKQGTSHFDVAFDTLETGTETRDLVNEHLKRDTRPIVQHVLKSNELNMSKPDATEAITDYQTMLTNSRSKKVWDLHSTDAWDIKIHGMNGKALDTSSISGMLARQESAALNQPEFSSGEGGNKNTFEVLKRYNDLVKVKGIQDELRLQFVHPLFEKILKELGHPEYPTPTIEFDIPDAIDRLKDAQADGIMYQILGAPARELIAVKYGLNLEKAKKMWEEEEEKAEAKERQEAMQKESEKMGLMNTDRPDEQGAPMSSKARGMHTADTHKTPGEN